MCNNNYVNHFQDRIMSRSEEDCSSSSEDEDVTVDEGKVQELEDKVCLSIRSF